VSTGGTPLRAGVLHIEELPMASERSLAYQMIRDAGPVVRDAHGAFLVTGAQPADHVLSTRICSAESSQFAKRAVMKIIPVINVRSGAGRQGDTASAELWVPVSLASARSGPCSRRYSWCR
jgi:hypothetical protein